MSKNLWSWEQDFVRLMQRIKHNGIKIDRSFCKSKKIIGDEICRKIKSDLGWNPGSPKQIGEVLIDQMGYPVFRRSVKTGNPSFDKIAMEEYELLLEHDGSDLAQKIFRYRGWSKTVSSNYKAYLDLADKEDVLHPNYKIHGTVTGRLSCEHPNLQQIPRESQKEWNGDLKQAFIPRGETRLINYDFSQLETRLAAAYAKEYELLEAFKEGIDVFQVMADRLSWSRDNVKTFNYATLYGAGAAKISMMFGLSSDEGKDMIEDFYGAYPNLRKKARKATKIAEAQGYITYWTGRRRHFGDKRDCHKAWNAIIQGGAFEIVKRQMIRTAEKVSYPMVLQVHDSVTFEIPVAECTDSLMEEIQSYLEDVDEAKEMGVHFAIEAKEWSKK